jgi:hypothetical protein
VERPFLGLALDLALLAVQAGFGPGCHVPSKAELNIPRSIKAEGGKLPWVEDMPMEKNILLHFFRNHWPNNRKNTC